MAFTARDSHTPLSKVGLSTSRLSHYEREESVVNQRN